MIRTALHHKEEAEYKVTSSAFDQLNREKYVFPVPVRARELVSRDGFGRPGPRQPANSPHSGWISCALKI